MLLLLIKNNLVNRIKSTTLKKTMKKLFKPLSICFIIAFCFNNTFAQCNLNDWTALKKIYESTNGIDWNNNTNWNLVTGNTPPNNCDLSTLYGISLGITGQSSGRVVMIDLRTNNLIGNIPPEIGLLSELDEIQMYTNQLSGVIPTEIGQLSKLTIIGLDYNQLSGSIPPEIGDLNNLTILIMNNNLLIGPIPAELGNLNNLTELWLFDNQLTGCFDSSLSSLCSQLDGYDDITSGNNFNTTWEDFCTIGDSTCSSNCDNNLVLSGNTSITQTYQVSHTITSTANIQANIAYYAGSCILLKEGFNLPANYSLEAIIESCN